MQKFQIWKNNMYKKRPETGKQWYKIYQILKENEEMTVAEISTQLNIPEPSIRRTLSEFKAINRIEIVKRPSVYKLI